MLCVNGYIYCFHHNPSSAYFNECPGLLVKVSNFSQAVISRWLGRGKTGQSTVRNIFIIW
jgi:hypothetical protein